MNRPAGKGPGSARAQRSAPAVEERIERLEVWSQDKLVSVWGQIERSPEEAGFRAAATSILAGFFRCAKRIEEELRVAARMRIPLQPCLRDVWHDHILFDGDAVSGVIDPSAARTDTIAADISRLAGSLVADDARGWDVAIAAYQSVRPLSPGGNSAWSAYSTAAGRSYRV